MKRIYSHEELESILGNNIKELRLQKNLTRQTLYIGDYCTNLYNILYIHVQTAQYTIYYILVQLSCYAGNIKCSIVAAKNMRYHYYDSFIIIVIVLSLL